MREILKENEMREILKENSGVLYIYALVFVCNCHGYYSFFVFNCAFINGSKRRAGNYGPVI